MLKTLAFLGIAAFAGRHLLKGRTGAEPAEKGTGAGHRPDDLLGSEHPDGSTRADPHYRPDIHAHVDTQDRESLRPVTMKSARGPVGV